MIVTILYKDDIILNTHSVFEIYGIIYMCVCIKQCKVNSELILNML